MSNAAEAKMLGVVETCSDPRKLRQIAENARRQGADELAKAAKLRLFKILPAEEPGTLEHDVWQSIYALEDALSEERRKTVRLARTRQKISRQGEAQCVADLIVGTASEGFRMLSERGMLALSFEAVALRHPSRFESGVLDAARERLSRAGFHN